MEIKTKYNIGDEVWIKWRDEAVKDRVTHIDIHVRKTLSLVSCSIMYTLLYAGVVPEDCPELFPTKEELLASL